MIEVIQGDITKLAVDVLVNAANSSLLGGGGVDGAIHRAGGPAILEECRAIRALQGGCMPGQAVITTAGKLPAQKVIHTVGPIWHEGKQKESETLANCYTSSLKLAVQNNLKTIAFPNISTGVYGYPKAAAAEVAVETVRSFINQHPDAFERVIFVCFEADNAALYRKRLEEY
ncbi:O-acetyl-ADP-ribose deacetylase [Siphonobacter sp. SORGH_AS_1065]|uniref:O-acetyl-ADP-ribose deacetylase n=1 Tax=Siphonobacter sp. SORGH_AS_1065 TaxID=3041795 RepID=UPI00278B2434|nr:O-acetyl-ADP-ribose deacetylase [Siphonobacter sp. SORGH_AS_1065]MDQ1087371.1 O-acetyl-ADP-ribose deacetylase (regulator of RNase III) [Siphonobacter sp. SORGH_AS_1065]